MGKVDRQLENYRMRKSSTIHSDCEICGHGLLWQQRLQKSPRVRRAFPVLPYVWSTIQKRSRSGRGKTHRRDTLGFQSCFPHCLTTSHTAS